MSHKKNFNMSNDNDFVEVTKNKKVNTLSSYDKDYINEIINDKYEMEYSSQVTEAIIDFEDAIENDLYIKIKNNPNNKSKSLQQIIKNNSAHYYQIKQDIHKNKSQYL